jgi:hypothetical protein
MHIKQYKGEDSYVRYGLVVQVFEPLSDTQELSFPDEYVPQYAVKAFPEMSSNAPYGVWIHRKEESPLSLIEGISKGREPIEDKYTHRKNDIDLIRKWQNSFR